mgnify:CR=1 FL=1
MRYVLFVIDGPGNPASGNEIAAIDAFNDRLNAGGHLVLAAGIAARVQDQQIAGHGLQADDLGAAEVEHPAAGRVGGGRQQQAVDAVVHVVEIAQLLAVAEADAARETPVRPAESANATVSATPATDHRSLTGAYLVGARAIPTPAAPALSKSSGAGSRRMSSTPAR